MNILKVIKIFAYNVERRYHHHKTSRMSSFFNDLVIDASIDNIFILIDKYY